MGELRIFLGKGELFFLSFCCCCCPLSHAINTAAKNESRELFTISEECRTRISDLTLRKEMFRLDIKKRFWTVQGKWLNSWGRLWKLHQCRYQRSARTPAVSRMLDGMKTMFSHNLVPCFCPSVLLLFESYIQTDGCRCLLFFRTDWLPHNQLAFSHKADSSYSM